MHPKSLFDNLSFSFHSVQLLFYFEVFLFEYKNYSFALVYFMNTYLTKARREYFHEEHEFEKLK